MNLSELAAPITVDRGVPIGCVAGIKTIEIDRNFGLSWERRNPYAGACRALAIEPLISIGPLRILAGPSVWMILLANSKAIFRSGAETRYFKLSEKL
jgi:hypothetical protein